MKRTFIRSAFVTLFIMMFVAFGLFSASALEVEYCVGEAVKVATYTELKTALENYKDGQSIILSKDIEITDDKNDLSVNIKGNGSVALELDGHRLTVKSKTTKYLFNLTGNAKLYFINSNTSNSGNIYFSSAKADSALLYINNNFARVTNFNVKFTMVKSSNYNASNSSVFCVNKARELNIYGGVIANQMSNGDGIKVVEGTNKINLDLRIGGGAVVQADRYCVVLNTDKINSVLFAASSFQSSSDVERIKVQSGCALKVKGLWDNTNSSYATTVRCGSAIVSDSTKVTSLKKSDITASKLCDVGTKVETILYCSGGHVEVCSICRMALYKIRPHNNEKVNGVSAGCTTSGKTQGNRCKDCRYSDQTTIPPKGHSLEFKKEVSATCGVNGMKQHYYCKSCNKYFSDAEAKTEISSSSLVIEHNHKHVNTAYVAPTCTEVGYSVGIVCQTCGRTVQERQVIPKTAHSYPANWTVIRKESCENEGIKEKTCKNCGYKLTEKTPKFDHVYDEEGTCYYCSKNEAESEPEKPGSTGDNKVNCSCSCHKDGILNFLFKIILFFQKIFRINQTCKGCGIAHY